MSVVSETKYYIYCDGIKAPQGVKPCEKHDKDPTGFATRGGAENDAHRRGIKLLTNLSGKDVCNEDIHVCRYCRVEYQRWGIAVFRDID